MSIREARLLAGEVRSELAAPVGIHIALYDADDERGAVRTDASGRAARADLQALQALLAASDADDSN
jgi:hypothetical protein